VPVAWSSHPDAATATGEVAGALLEASGGDAVRFLWVTASAGYLAAFPGIVAGLRTVLRPDVAIGGTVRGILGSGDRAVNGPVAGIVAGVFAVDSGGIATHRIEGPADGWPTAVAGTVRLALGAVPPASLPATGTECVIASTSGPRGRAGLLALDDAVHADGAVAVDFGPSTAARSVVAPAYVPLSPTLTATAVRGPVLRRLADRDPVAVISDALGLDQPPGPGFADRLLVGMLADTEVTSTTPAELRPLRVLAIDPASGALTLAGDVPLGAPLRILLRDPPSRHPALADGLGGSGRMAILASGPGASTSGPDDPVTIANAAGEPGSVVGAVHGSLSFGRDGRIFDGTHVVAGVVFGREDHQRPAPGP